MGAATTILYAGTFKDEADFHIVDCPFSDFSEQILHILRKNTPLRTSMALRIANFFLKMRDGYTLKPGLAARSRQKHYKTGAFHPQYGGRFHPSLYDRGIVRGKAR